MPAGYEMLRDRTLTGDVSDNVEPDAQAGALGWRYLLFAFGLSTALTSGWVRRTLIGWQAWELTHSSSWIGIIGFCALMPMLLVGPLAGVAVDRHPARHMLFITQISGLVLTLALGALAWGRLIDVSFLLAVTIGTAITVSFESPASNVFIRAIVREDALARAISVNSVIGNGALLVAPGLAVFLLGKLGLTAAYLIAAIGHLACLACVFIVRAPATPVAEDTERSGYLGDIKSGLRYVGKSAELRMLFTSFFIVSVGARSLTYLMPAFAAERFANSPEILGILLSALAAGAVCAGLCIGLQKTGFDVWTMLLWSIVANAACLAAVAGLPGLTLATVSMFSLGVAFACNSISTQTALQTITPQQMNGRMLSLYGIAFRTGPALGSLALGAFAATFGMVGAELLAAAGMAVYAGSIWFCWAGAAAPTPKQFGNRSRRL